MPSPLRTLPVPPHSPQHFLGAGDGVTCSRVANASPTHAGPTASGGGSATGAHPATATATKISRATRFTVSPWRRGSAILWGGTRGHRRRHTCRRD